MIHRMVQGPEPARAFPAWWAPEVVDTADGVAMEAVTKREIPVVKAALLMETLRSSRCREAPPGEPEKTVTKPGPEVAPFNWWLETKYILAARATSACRGTGPDGKTVTGPVRGAPFCSKRRTSL